MANWLHETFVKPVKRGYAQPASGGTGIGFNTSGGGGGGPIGVQQRGQQFAPKPDQHAPAPAPAPVASPGHQPFGPSPMGSSPAQSAPAAQVPFAPPMPSRGNAIAGVGRPQAQAYRTPGISDHQNATAPSGPGDPGGQLHPLIRSVMQTPGSMDPPQYITRQNTLAAPNIGDIMNQMGQHGILPGQAAHAPLGMTAMGQEPQHFGQAMQGAYGPSSAETALQGLHAQTGLNQAAAYHEQAHGMAQEAMERSRNPAGVPTGPYLDSAMKLQAARTGTEQPVEMPWRKYPVLSMGIANPAFHENPIGILRQTMQAEGIPPGSPEWLDMVQKILASQGIDPTEAMNANAGGWFGQSEPSRLNQEFLRGLPQLQGR